MSFTVKSRSLVRVSSLVILALMALVVSGRSAVAQDSWSLAGNGDWDVAGNWSAGVPTSTVNAVNNTNYNITHSQNVTDTVNSFLSSSTTAGFTLSSGGLAGATSASTFQVNSGALLYGGLSNFIIQQGTGGDLSDMGSGYVFTGDTINSNISVAASPIFSGDKINANLQIGNSSANDIASFSNGSTFGAASNITVRSAGSGGLDFTDSSDTLSGATCSVNNSIIKIAGTLTVASGESVMYNAGSFSGGALINSGTLNGITTTPTVMFSGGFGLLNSTFTNNSTGVFMAQGAYSNIYCPWTNNGAFTALSGGTVTTDYTSSSGTNNGMITAMAGGTVRLWDDSFTNAGTISANGTGAMVAIAPRAQTYSLGGTLESSGTNAIVEIGSTTLSGATGPQTVTFPSNLTMTTSAGGEVEFATTLDNTGKVFDPTVNIGGTQNFVNNGTILNGQLTHSYQLLFGTGSQTNGTIDNVACDSGFDIAGSTATLKDNTTFGAGSATTVNQGGYLTIEVTGHLNNMTMTFGATPGLRSNTIVMGVESGITIDSTALLHGADGAVQGYQLTNNGTIEQDVSGGSITLDPTTLVNGTTGAIRATGANTNLSISNISLTNNGLLEAVNGGALAVNIGPTVQPTSAGTIHAGAGSSVVFEDGYVQSAGATNVDSGGTLSLTNATNSQITINGGVLAGAGTVTGAVQNGSHVRPGDNNGIGTLTINGQCSQTGNGNLDINIGGTGTSLVSLLNVEGLSIMNGALNVNFVNGFTPVVGNTFIIEDYTSGEGVFSSVTNSLPLSDNLIVTASYFPTYVQLRVAGVAPGPDSLAVFGAGLLGGAAAQRRRKAARNRRRFVGGA